MDFDDEDEVEEFSIKYHFGTSLPTLKRSSDLVGVEVCNLGFFDFATIDRKVRIVCLSEKMQ